MHPELLSPKEFAQAFRVTSRTVYNWIAEARIAHVRIGGTVRIPADEITKALRQRDGEPDGGFLVSNHSMITERLYKNPELLSPFLGSGK